VGTRESLVSRRTGNLAYSRKPVRALCLVVLSGCHILFELQPVETADTVLCDDPLIDDPFDDGRACEEWGHPLLEKNCAISELADGLVIAPAASTASRGRCTSNGMLPLTERGIMVEVSDVLLSDDGDFTLLSLASPTDLSLGVSNRRLGLTNNLGSAEYGKTTYVRDQMRWWRLRREGPSIVGEYAADGIEWRRLGAVAKADTEVTLFLFAGLNGNGDVAAEGRAVYRRLIVCR
jgi:hypothetical protein